MFTEDQLLSKSALQHLLFCERQCASMHPERVWAEKRFTVEGQHLRRKARCKLKLLGLIDVETDTLRFYYLEVHWQCRVKHAGVKAS